MEAKTISCWPNFDELPINEIPDSPLVGMRGVTRGGNLNHMDLKKVLWDSS